MPHTCAKQCIKVPLSVPNQSGGKSQPSPVDTHDGLFWGPFCSSWKRCFVGFLRCSRHRSGVVSFVSCDLLPTHQYRIFIRSNHTFGCEFVRSLVCESLPLLRIAAPRNSDSADSTCGGVQTHKSRTQVWGCCSNKSFQAFGNDGVQVLLHCWC